MIIVFFYFFMEFRYVWYFENWKYLQLVYLVQLLIFFIIGYGLCKIFLSGLYVVGVDKWKLE